MQIKNVITPLVIRSKPESSSSCRVSFLVVKDGKARERQATNVLTEAHIEAMVSRWRELRCPVVDLRGELEDIGPAEVRQLAVQQLQQNFV